MNKDYVRQIINLTQTTSGSYLLMSSLDISRKQLALHGKEIFKKVVELTEYARDEINKIGGYYAYSREIINGDTIYDFDQTKLIINTFGTGLTGIEVYDLIRDEYDIQLEFGDIGNTLAYISVGDSYKDIERLVSALAEIYRLYRKDAASIHKQEYVSPEVAVSPQDAFYSETETVELEEADGHICGEFVMCYPPGIPILAPGERVTREIIEHIKYSKEKGCFLTGTKDLEVNHLEVLKGVK